MSPLYFFVSPLLIEFAIKPTMIQCHGWDTLAVFLHRQTDAQTDEPTTFIHKAKKSYRIARRLSAKTGCR